MQLDSRQLAAFAAVLRAGSFDAAARALHVTPSAVSQRIKALEERLGRVLIRRGSPCVATEAGESLQRHAQQLQLLEAQALAPFGLAEALPAAKRGPAATPLPLAIAVNADSLATWFVPALAALRQRHNVCLDLHVEDQDHSSELLRQGRVLAAVSAEPAPVQGCRVRPLGRMRYLAVASPAFMQRHFPDGLTDAALAQAPCNVFNQKDQLQSRFLRQLSTRRLSPPQHRVPSTHGFVHAALHGLGWGMNPDVLVAPLLARGDLVELAPGQALDVPLYWQHWSLEAEVLRTLTEAVTSAAKAALRPMRGPASAGVER
ncbi:LysR family transcriptional regulator ArgP [uncultured Piscinibacter sp.]|uniref:LysR family transcriptional regulator ArgP n=1 Tax=uncultured Piscinibacter sp. TaxID=1131835 RepID=UPI00262A525B|nr:LysR family transcriptional regulator ArgP [uncultured Piscinibacter sp.]